MLSDLAEHARNLKADPRASLLYAAGPGGDALAEARVSVLGRMAPVETLGEAAPGRARYLARNPTPTASADFGHFGLCRLNVAREPPVARFVRHRWADRADLPRPGAAAVCGGADREIGHARDP